MKTIVAFAGSDSKTSINKQLATYTAGLVENATVKVLDLNDYELPLYGIDRELESGVPENAHKFLKTLQEADGIVLSLAEHNGSYATVFKNIFDWMSRIDGKLWGNVPMLLMATSPGARGGQTVLDIAKGRFPYMGGNIVGDYSLPSFNEHFVAGKIKDATLLEKLHVEVAKLKAAVNEA
ncbi:NAD(P)H-dependent oxidoreductase [Kordia sp. YSTF-M3]|uniref:NAD(P)H-dependent oxidoreductase n=1 Tax=Kordia aestuariivivens TaxID=2759037 RepID=A0ABR7Q7Y8_9FLAO|nr:NAD(P)H-dependent oxidoreductase [Kordia aestuariivivens]MBC8754553.1 NAD(P)H-dependent oxidoreductase [Kordia aestuariivivens]